MDKPRTSTEIAIEADKASVHHEESLDTFTPQEKKRLMRRIDSRLVITLGVLYCISLLDRTNLGSASVAGYILSLDALEKLLLTTNRMQGDLNMNASNNGYSITSLVFFITYTIFQIPAPVLIRKLGPRLFLSGIVLAWGATMIV